MATKQNCDNCGKEYSPEWWDRGYCYACDQEEAWKELQSIRAIDAELQRRGDEYERIEKIERDAGVKFWKP